MTGAYGAESKAPAKKTPRSAKREAVSRGENSPNPDSRFEPLNGTRSIAPREGGNATGGAMLRAPVHGKGERIEIMVHPANAKAPREASCSPSPFIPLPLGEGERRGMLPELFAVLARRRFIVL